MSRKKARENAFLAMFEMSFKNATLEEIIENAIEKEENQLDDYGKKIIGLFEEHQTEIDMLIASKLKGWQPERIPRVSYTALRLAVTEMLYSGKDMVSIAINEAVDLTKKYGDETDYQFVNGVLGSIARESIDTADITEKDELSEC
ncbi:MAG: transcription antitermination factor NusB [Oscillospiraceae bacterium]|nr:transcription antitermination factor NusB [Oscillospiraceae bacterium]